MRPELHEDSPEAYYVHTPGIKVAIPSTPSDAKGLLAAAIRSDDPVVIMEPRSCTEARARRSGGRARRSARQGARGREGDDVTLVAYGGMVPVALAAADELEASAEVVDMRSLKPLDEETLLASVGKTGRAVIVQEAPRVAGFGAEIAAVLAEKAILDLRGPVVRVTGYDVPFPFWSIEDHYLPSPARVVEAANRGPLFLLVAYEFKLPDLGEGVREGEIARWLVRVGETVAEDDPLVEIQTDKTTVEIPSPAAGTVARILVEEGKLVPVGTPLVVIGDGDVAAARRRGPAAACGEGAGNAARPQDRGRARRRSRLGQRYRSGRSPHRGRRSPAAPAREGERREPLRGVRREIARHLATAHREVPPVTVVEECDFSEIARTRGERSYLPYLLQATVAGLKQVPELNAALAGDEIVFWERYDLGVAVQTDQGLVVPVLRAADEKDLDELEAEAARLAGGRPQRHAQAGGAPRLDVHGDAARAASAVS